MRTLKGITMLSFLLASAAITCSTHTENKSLVTFVLGKAAIKRGAALTIPAALKTEVLDGDVVSTGRKSCLVIQSADGIVLRLEENTESVISSLNLKSKREIDLLKGKLFSRVIKLKQGDEYIVKTPMAVAAVRGTEFLTEYMGERIVVAVASGRVLVTRTVKAGDRKMVEVGKMAVVAEDKDIIEIKALGKIEERGLSLLQTTPGVRDAERKSAEELKDLFKNMKLDEAKEDRLTLEQIRARYGRVDVITLYNGRIIEGVILSRGNSYKVMTPTGTFSVNAMKVKGTSAQ